jgi:outer membrane protein
MTRQRTMMVLGFCIIFCLVCGVACGTAADAAGQGDGGMREIYRALPARLDLETAKQYAMRQNPTIAVAAARLRGAAAVYRQARSAFFPTLSISAEARHTHDTPVSQSFVAVESFENYAVSANVQWLLFDGLSRQFEALAAKQGEHASRAAYDEARRLLLQSVSVAFNEALLAAENVIISQEDAAFNEQLAEETRKKRQAGTAARSDVLNFEIRAAQARDNLLQYEQLNTTARLALAELMGIPSNLLSPETELVFSEEMLEQTLPPSVENELLFAFANRPDVLEQQRLADQQRAFLRARRGDYLPTIQLQGAYGWSRRDDIHFRDETDASSYVGVTASWDIFTGGRRMSAVAEAEAGLSAALSALQGRELAVEAEVRQEHQRLVTALARLGIQRQIQEKTVETKDLVLKAYREGQESLIRLNEVQADVVRASGNLALARIRVAQAWENLDAATARILEGAAAALAP